MKAWKTEIIESIKAETEHARIVSLKEISDSKGINHIQRQDVRDIMIAVLKLVPEYRAVRLEKTPHDSLFQSLCFVENGVEFDDGEEA